LQLEETESKYGGYFRMYWDDLPAWSFNGSLTVSHHRKLACYKMLHDLDLVGCLEYGNEPSGSIKDRGFF
jgi:acetoacetate decarboxylase